MKKEIEVSINQYLDSIFEKIPSNALINKGRCGIGGTTLEIETPRHSIIVVPTKGIIDNKCKNKDGEVDTTYKIKPKIFGVMGKIKSAKLVSIFQDKHPVKKIFTTPTGLKKIMECGYSKELIEENWFLLYDEFHTAITDSFRDDILIPFDFFWDFPKENRAMISATPYFFSDERFSELDLYHIKIKEKLGTIEVIHTESVTNCLHYILTNTTEFKGNIHIFFNSVTAIANALRTAQINYGASVYIAETEKNMDKLDELALQFFDKPTKENISKINFYTSRYFEGWDLIDEIPTIVLVTDTGITTTKLGIPNKAFQAVGRSRNPVERIIHITNHLNKKERQSFEDIQKQNMVRAHSVIKSYNQHSNDSITKGFDIDKQMEEICEKYANISVGFAEYNSYLADQFINQEYCNQDYNHIDYIREAWESMNYDVKDVLFDAPEIPKTYSKSSMANKIRWAISCFDFFNRDKDRFFINRYDEVKVGMPREAIEWIDACKTLGKAAIEGVGYKPAEIKKLMIKAHNLKMEPEKRIMVHDAFPSGKYQLEKIKAEFHRINTELGIKDSKGEYKAGSSKELYSYFEIIPKGNQARKGCFGQAKFGKYTFSIDGVVVRKSGVEFY